MHELAILQAARMKGRLSAEAAAASAGVDAATATTEVDRLREAGLVKGDPAVRLTPEGRARLAELVAEERDTLDVAALAPLYEEFDDHNTTLKDVVSAWQMRDGSPNDHGDPDYDASVVDRLVELDDGFRPLVARIADVAPRLEHYQRRFAHAVEQVRAGDHTFIARPITDSYHTVWFEFHEELIGLLGLSREEEAAAGRAV